MLHLRFTSVCHRRLLPPSPAAAARTARAGRPAGAAPAAAARPGPASPARAAPAERTASAAHPAPASEHAVKGPHLDSPESRDGVLGLSLQAKSCAIGFQYPISFWDSWAVGRTGSQGQLGGFEKVETFDVMINQADTLFLWSPCPRSYRISRLLTKTLS